jgi:hypothetical protein
MAVYKQPKSKYWWYKFTWNGELPLRTILRLSLYPPTGVRRPGHRVEWIADALAPARNKIDSEAFSKLSKALTLMLGIGN